jgi:hypothetical protein
MLSWATEMPCSARMNTWAHASADFGQGRLHGPNVHVRHHGCGADASLDRHLLIYLDEAHIHQDTGLGYGCRAAPPSVMA